MMESLVTDSLRRSAVHKAVNSCGRTHQSAHALLWEEVARVIKVIALKQEALFGKERTWFFFISHLEAGGLFRGRNRDVTNAQKSKVLGVPYPMVVRLFLLLVGPRHWASISPFCSALSLFITRLSRAAR